jgi:hypothetical protein
MDPLGRHLKAADCVFGTVWAEPLAGGDGVVDEDVPATPASTIKVPIAQAVLNAVAGGGLDGRSRVLLASDGRTPGPVTVSLMTDDVELSLRRVTLSLTVSDNPATDALIAAVGVDAVNGLVRGLRLVNTWLTSNLRTKLDEMAVEAGFADLAALEVAQPGLGVPAADELRQRLAATAALDPARGSRMTARDGSGCSRRSGMTRPVMPRPAPRYAERCVSSSPAIGSRPASRRRHRWPPRAVA